MLRDDLFPNLFKTSRRYLDPKAGDYKAAGWTEMVRPKKIQLDGAPIGVYGNPDTCSHCLNSRLGSSVVTAAIL
ncbi:hypothetical protein GWI33_021268 [Rhynchophorus ferrugineus]|uniref:Uncharacterized protein n=1 Tax=Rhynchophorus ferrugineus TaxID=354439 RepID=A0A834M4X8_RHYFE|nr:hypothetical protein GWI33_021268 [Rhynchophorus ferrugineus]